MTQYIDKAALVAELDRLYDLEYDGTSDLSCGKKMMLRHILLFLNTLEVKEEVTTTTNTLIEKACEWLRNNIESDEYLSPDEESYRMGCGVDYLETNMFIEDFKNYMKGE